MRASTYLDEILFSVGSPAASRDSFAAFDSVPVPTSIAGKSTTVVVSTPRDVKGVEGDVGGTLVDIARWKLSSGSS